jgi:hypothetical protein
MTEQRMVNANGRVADLAVARMKEQRYKLESAMRASAVRWSQFCVSVRPENASKDEMHDIEGGIAELFDRST